jgi:3-oxoacyl-[acyl-carrier protein] reductase
MQSSALSGRIALVTGASRGIGKHIAAALRAAGAAVGITGRHGETLARAAAEVGGGCRPFVCDHRRPEAIRRLAEAVAAELGEVDLLVNNAGVFRSGPVLSLPLEVWDEVLETNLTGVFLATQAFLPAMIERARGDIFMISSMSGKKGDPNTAAYNASKFGLQGFSQALMHEVRRSNIRVVVLNPSTVDTGPDSGRKEGPGLHLHAADIAATVVHLAALPRRTLVRDLDIYGTNPFTG